MCGIIGAINKGSTGFNTNDLKAFGDLMYFNTLRGMDSSGVIHVDQEGNVDVVKDTMAGNWFTSIKDYEAIVEKKAYQVGKLLVGHNRKATIGKVNIENAHPFVVNDELVLVHNGSLVSHKNLADKESDSHSIAIHLHKNFNDGNIGDVMGEINGAYALVWYDVRTNKVNIVRNSQRPLWMCETSQHWWWASEPYMLWAALDRNNLKVTENTMKQLKVNTLYSMDLEKAFFNTKWEETDVPFVQPSAKKASTLTVVGGSTTTGQQTTMATTCTQRGGKHSRTHAVGSEGDLSKNKFKDVYKRFLGSSIDFTADDFVDIDDNGFNYYFYGTSMDVDIPHYIVGESSEATAVAIMDAGNFAAGMVVNAWYDKAEKKAVLKVIPSVRITKGKKHHEGSSTVH